MDATAIWSTRANALTLVRLLLAPAFAAAVLDRAPVFATALFFLAVGTDLADGWVARRYGEETPFGGFADHAADAIFVVTGTAALARTGVLPAPLPWLIAAAFLQYALDSRALTASGLFPSRLGRWNGIAYYVIAAIPIVRDALALVWPGPDLLRALGWALIASTAVSMADRLQTWRRRLRPEAGNPDHRSQ
ncbi:MAG: CDP-alcohol phosphatidyltransferase family protein [Deltaproteobacteria bacterium]|nr:MAG: CDP-alcohol phosphatidyltransferase family protein [Deltaproteobacteria bacterium]